MEKSGTMCKVVAAFPPSEVPCANWSRRCCARPARTRSPAPAAGPRAVFVRRAALWHGRGLAQPSRQRPSLQSRLSRAEDPRRDHGNTEVLDPGADRADQVLQGSPDQSTEPRPDVRSEIDIVQSVRAHEPHLQSANLLRGKEVTYADQQRRIHGRQEPAHPESRWI